MEQRLKSCSNFHGLWCVSKLEATRCLLLQLCKHQGLVSFLNEDLAACQNAGMHVVTTICDMSANSVKVLKLLDTTKWKAFFMYQNQHTVAVYDSTHCLKCTRKLFLKYDM